MSCSRRKYFYLLMFLGVLLVVLWWNGKKTIDDGYFELNFEKHLQSAVDHNPAGQFADIGLIHPTKPENLWVKVNEKIIIRRLAFHDRRDSSFPSVIFNCLYDDHKLMENPKQTLYSLLTFKNGVALSTLCVPLEYWASSGDKARQLRYKEYYYNYLLRTKSPIVATPLYGQISVLANCSSLLTKNIPIKNDSVDKVYTYGVCLHKSIFNLTEPEMLVHWIELNLALGAEIITVYFQPGYISESYYTIILPYIRRGIVEVLDWGLIPPVVPGYTKDWGQPAVINECVYRNMYRVKYLGLYDLDEFLVPQKVKTIPQMIQKLEKKDHKTRTAASYSFCNAFFYHKENNFLPEVNLTNLTRHCSKLPRYYTTVVREDLKLCHFKKIIVKPKVVISAWTHWLIKYSRGFVQTYIIPNTEGLLHHYRVPVKFFSKTTATVQTHTMSRYFNETVKGIIKYTCT